MEPAQPEVETAIRPADGWARFSLALISVAVVVAFGAIKLVRPLGHHFTTTGDVAFIELGVRQALHHGNALGVYSRFGWHHPGPALFYLYAPWYLLSGESSRSLFLSAWLVNGGAALGAVWFVRARSGERVARVMVVLLFAFAWVAGFGHFIDPWNPKVLALPVLLLMVTAAAAYSGSAWSLVVALVTASYLVQTHLGTLPVAVSLLALAAFGFWRTEKPPWRVPLIVAAGLLTVMWIGPIVQEVTHANGNLTQIARFFVHPKTTGPRSHSVKDSVIVVSNHATILPFGFQKGTHGHAGRVVLAGAFAALGLGAAFGARRRAPFVAALGLTTAIGLGVAVIAASRVIGPQDGFLFYWTEALPIPALVAAAWLVLDRVPAGHARTAVDIATALGVALCLAFTLRSVAIARPGTFGDAATARAVARRIEQEVGDKNRPFVLHVDTKRLDRASLAVQFDKDGYRFRLEPTVDLYRGNVGGTFTGPRFEIHSTGTPAPAGSGERLVATIARVDISVQP